MDGGYEAPRGQAAYVVYGQVSSTRLSIVAVSRASTAEAISSIRRAVGAADPLVAASGITTLDGLVSAANALPQLRAGILLVFALAAVLITALGLIKNHMRPEHYERAEETVERLKRGDFTALA